MAEEKNTTTQRPVDDSAEAKTAETSSENKEAEANQEPKKAKKKAKPKKQSELEIVKAELEAQKNLLLRTAAEFDNFKRRTEKERISVAEYAKADMLKNFLPVFDNIDRAHSFDPQSTEYAKGIELTVKMLNEVVAKLGLVAIGQEGETFDPNLHQAVMHVEDETKGENVITAVLQKGYKIGDTVVRPAMVQVAN